jgi:AraC-like DNA-binding protein/mannose-6-phosphate isomerase-like protein (cupin superfamily)
MRALISLVLSGHRTHKNRETMKHIRGEPDWNLSDRQRHEAYEGACRMLPELPLLGRMHLLDALPESLVSHSHPGIYEVHCVMRGVQHFWVGKDTFQVGAGMAFLTRPGEVHGAVNSCLSPGEWFWLHIQFPRKGPLPGLSLADTRKIQEALDSAPHRLFQSSYALRSALGRLLEEHHSILPFGKLMARLAYHELLIYLVRDLCPAGEGSRRQFVSYSVRQATGWINQHLMESFSMHDVAVAAGLSESGLRRRFHNELGQSPAEYVIQQRIERAKQLLRETNRPITDIAFALGFNSSPYFGAVFKRQTGHTPSQFRELCLKGAR